MKPVELIARMLSKSTKPGDVVLDLFGCSRSTLICGERLGRGARVCELDPRFADVIVRRWQDFTGSHAVLVGDRRNFAEIGVRRTNEGAR